MMLTVDYSKNSIGKSSDCNRFVLLANTGCETGLMISYKENSNSHALFKQ
jgi:hypothetical protein